VEFRSYHPKRPRTKDEEEEWHLEESVLVRQFINSGRGAILCVLKVLILRTH
jgi:hypothetical protein